MGNQSNEELYQQRKVEAEKHVEDEINSYFDHQLTKQEGEQYGKFNYKTQMSAAERIVAGLSPVFVPPVKAQPILKAKKGTREEEKEIEKYNNAYQEECTKKANEESEKAKKQQDDFDTVDQIFQSKAYRQYFYQSVKDHAVEKELIEQKVKIILADPKLKEQIIGDPGSASYKADLNVKARGMIKDEVGEYEGQDYGLQNFRMKYADQYETIQKENLAEGEAEYAKKVDFRAFTEGEDDAALTILLRDMKARPQEFGFAESGNDGLTIEMITKVNELNERIRYLAFEHARIDDFISRRDIERKEVGLSEKQIANLREISVRSERSELFLTNIRSTMMNRIVQHKNFKYPQDVKHYGYVKKEDMKKVSSIGSFEEEVGAIQRDVLDTSVREKEEKAKNDQKHLGINGSKLQRLLPLFQAELEEGASESYRKVVHAMESYVNYKRTREVNIPGVKERRIQLDQAVKEYISSHDRFHFSSKGDRRLSWMKKLQDIIDRENTEEYTDQFEVRGDEQPQEVQKKLRENMASGEPQKIFTAMYSYLDMRNKVVNVAGITNGLEDGFSTEMEKRIFSATDDVEVSDVEAKGTKEEKKHLHAEQKVMEEVEEVYAETYVNSVYRVYSLLEEYKKEMPNSLKGEDKETQKKRKGYLAYRLYQTREGRMYLNLTSASMTFGSFSSQSENKYIKNRIYKGMKKSNQEDYNRKSAELFDIMQLKQMDVGDMPEIPDEIKLQKLKAEQDALLLGQKYGSDRHVQVEVTNQKGEKKLQDVPGYEERLQEVEKKIKDMEAKMAKK